MRIISEHHDYYDGVQIYGQDGGLQYVRRPLDEDLGETWPFPWIIPHRENNFRLKNHVIGFCGKIHPVLHLYTLGSSWQKEQEAYCYTLEEVDAFVAPLLNKKELATYHSTEKWYYNSFHVASRRLQYKGFFDAFAEIADKNQWRFEKNLSPVFVASLKGRAYGDYPYRGQSHKPDRADPGQKIVWNGNLKDFQFARIKDPYTAYQEISMYLGNMAFPNKPIPEIDDKTMAEIKGFNKFSFRKDKAT